MVCNKLFREDLFYRINTVHLELPPLRERKEDIRPLAERFAAFFAKKYDKPALTLSDSAVHALESCYWRGNIRELHHVMEKAVIFASGKQIDKSDLHIHDIEMQAGQDAETIEDMEKSLICKTLEKSGGNLSLTASKLGITRQTLYNKLKRYGIDSI